MRIPALSIPALSILALLGLATLAVPPAAAHATPAVSATITIAPGGHGHQGYHRGPAPRRDRRLARSYRHHRPAYATRFHRAPVVIFGPARRHHW